MNCSWNDDFITHEPESNTNIKSYTHDDIFWDSYCMLFSYHLTSCKNISDDEILIDGGESFPKGLVP